MKSALYQNRTLRFLLSPLAIVYYLITYLRNLFYDQEIIKAQKFSVPVISIGNITTGGTGKTPLTMFLIDILKTNHNKIAVVSRGYGRRSKGPVIVCDGKGNIVDAATGGDEAVMVAKRFPQCVVIVANKRVDGINIAIREYGSELILLDDAFQHRKVQRHCDIVLIDATAEIHNDHLLPWGNLREPLTNLKRADLLIFTKSSGRVGGKELEVVKKYFSGTILWCDHTVQNFVDRELNTCMDLQQLRKQSVVAFAAIAQPLSFKRMLLDNDIVVKEYLTYADHHYYRQKDIDSILAVAKAHECDYLLTTEKDLVKLSGFDFAGFKLVGLRIGIQLNQHLELLQKLNDCIDKAIKNV